LAAVARSTDLPDGDRTLDYVFEHPIDDGGQWDLFAALVAKHGLVPKQVMPETDSCERSGPMNSILREILRDAACAMRTSARKTADACERAKLLDQLRAETVKKVHRTLCLHLGSPPETFSWSWFDKNAKAVRRVTDVTPLEFAKLALGEPGAATVADFVSLVHDPRDTSPAMRTFTVDYLGTVVGAPEVKYLNVADPAVLKGLARKQLEAGMCVWFGCDSGKSTDKKEGIYDDRLYEIDQVLGFTRSSLTKA
jgi:bleomycin hydrolase